MVCAVDERVGERRAVAPAAGPAAQRVSGDGHAFDDDAAAAWRGRRGFIAFDEVPYLGGREVDEAVEGAEPAACSFQDLDDVDDADQKRGFPFDNRPPAVAAARRSNGAATAEEQGVRFAAAGTREYERGAERVQLAVEFFGDRILFPVPGQDDVRAFLRRGRRGAQTDRLHRRRRFE